MFVAAMTMREEPAAQRDAGAGVAAKEQLQPLFKEVVEIPAALAPLAAEIQAPSQPVQFALPPVVAVEEQKSPAPAAVAALPAPAPSRGSAVEIEVQKGDSLERLAKKHHTSVDEIIKLNQLPSSFLKVGQRLKIPAERTAEVAQKPKSSPSPALSEQAEYYTMKVGDNPWSVAMKHHMKVDELLKLNGLNEKTARKLKPGDRLRIR
jgi:LysM repeat protein